MSMRNLLALCVALLATAPALADESRIGQETLALLGLGGMQNLSDADGMEIRGQASGFAMVIGTSSIFGQMITPDTKSFIFGSDINMVQGNVETTNALASATAVKDHASALSLGLGPILINGVNVFQGVINGTVGGKGIAAGHFVRP